MGLLVDISKEYNQSMVDLKDVYLRINSVNIYPKYGIVKFLVAGYLSKDSGQILRQAEYDMMRYVDSVYQTTAVEISNDEKVTMGYLINRDMIIPPQQMGFEPLQVFRDVYTVKLLEMKIESISCDVLYPRIYSLLKSDHRFLNIRDDL